METLETWLQGLGLEKYASALRTQEVELDQLPTLTDADLKEIGIPLGPRKRILEAAARLAEKPPGEKTQSQTAERRQVTIMFVDLVGSTSLSGRLDPEDLRQVLRRYHETCAAAIKAWGGTVAKLMGDGVLAYFGWPQAEENSAERAIRAGLAINEDVGRSATPAGEALSARTGIATGLVVIGDLIGEGAAQEAAVAGETPNLAARLQSTAEPGGLVVSAQTLALAGAHFETQSLAPLSLKGIAAPVRAYVVKGVRKNVTRFAAHAQSKDSPLLGRDSESALLFDRFRRARDGEGQLAILIADAGMGKSRLAHAALEAMGAGPQSRITWQCAPHHTSTAFHPVLPAMEPGFVASLSPQDRLAIERLKGIVPPDPNATPGQARHAALLAIGRAVAAQPADKGPPVLLVEDAHWIDPSTLDVIESNLDAWAHAGVFVLLTARPAFAADFGGHECITRLTLSRLDRQGVAALAQTVARGLPLPREALDAIAAKSDGVPLYVEETTKALIDYGAVILKGGAWTLARALSESSVPATLADGLMARLDRLGDSKGTAQEAAVIGRQFSYADLNVVSTARPPHLRTALQRLTDAQILHTQPAGDGEQYEFKHALLRDAAYESMLKTQRAALHEKFARSLEANPASPLELRAWHVEAAGRRDDARSLWRSAGEAALLRPAYREAISHFRRALSLADGAETLKVETRLGLAAIAAHGHSHPDTVAIFEAASQSPHLTQDPASAFVVWYGLWCGHHVRGEAASARASSAALHRASLAEGSPANIMMGVRSLGITSLMNGDVPAALERHAEAESLEDIPRDRGQAQIVGQDQSVSFRSYYGIALWLAGQARRSWAMIEQSIQLARESGHPGSLGYGLTHAILAAYGLGETRAAETWTQELLEKATEYRLGLWRDYALRFDGLRIARTTGDDTPMSAARDAMTARSVGLFAAYLDVLMAEALISRGDLKRGEDWLNRAGRALQDGQECWAGPLVSIAQARLASAKGQENAAIQYASKAISSSRAGGLTAFELQALTLRADDAKMRSDLRGLADKLDAPSHYPGLAEASAILAKT